jgi:predicted permease
MREWLTSIWVRLRTLSRKKRLDDELEAELAFHLEMRRAAELEAAGGSPRPGFGNATLIKERCRDQWLFAPLEGAWLDLRQVLRTFRRSRGFVAVAVLSLALGIGANASVYSVMNALFLRSLPVRQPEELRILNWSGGERVPIHSHSGYGEVVNGVQTSGSFSFEAFKEFRNRAMGLSSVFAFANMRANVVANSRAWISEGLLVSGNFFEGLGTTPAVGRLFETADDKPGSGAVAVISYGLWQREFAGDEAAVGSAITVNRIPFTLIGVLPPKFTGLSPGSSQDIFVPITHAAGFSPWYQADESYNWWVQTGVRLAPGSNETSVKASLDIILAQVTSAYASQKPDKFDVPAVRLMDGSSGLTFTQRDTSRFLLVLMTMVGLTLIIACANLANLMLARATARSRELAVRASLGAGTWRTVRLLLTEGLLIGLAGGVLGFALAIRGSGLLIGLASTRGSQDFDVGPDWRVALFTFAVALLTAVLFSILPAWRATRVNAGSALKQSGATASAFRQRAAQSLIALQVAISMLLVIGAGLFARTLVNMTRVDLGFKPEKLLLFYVDGSRNGYQDQALADLYTRIGEKVRAIPGVTAATQSENALISGSNSTRSINVPGYTPKPNERLAAHVHTAGERFLTIMGTPILLGRDLLESDTDRAPDVAVINETMARKWFRPNPIGQEFHFGNTSRENPVRVVGVARDAKYASVRQEIPPTMYIPYRQSVGRLRSTHFELRTAVPPLSIIPAVRRAIAEIDPTLPVAEFRTQEQQIDRRMARERTFTLLAAFFSFISLALACIGIYGVLAYAVTRRTSEIGVRLALGAPPRQVQWLVVRDSILVVLLGIVAGVGGALAAVQLVRKELYEVEPADPVSIVIAITAMAMVAGFAAFLPARRAAGVDPMVALRYE